jgi:outer membrane protein TolC
MELAEHRSTTERAHRAELTAKDATIAQQRYEITDLRRRLAESEADAYRLRVALQVLTGRPLPETALSDDEASSTADPERPTDHFNG